MPGKRISELTALSGAGSANNDDLVIFDSGAGETKRISRSQLAEGMVEDLPFLYFHGVLTSDPAQRLNGDSLEIGDGYLRSSDMIFRYYTSSGWQNYEQIAIAAATAQADRAENEADRAEVARDDAQALDGRHRRDVATLLADTTLTYTAAQPGTVVAGDVVRTRAEGFSYEVAASGATDHHVTTAGGVKLYVLTSAASAFGAVGDGVTDDTAVFKLIEAATGDTIDLVSKTYALTSFSQDTTNGIQLRKDYQNGKILMDGRPIVFDSVACGMRSNAALPRLQTPHTNKKLGLLKADDNNYEIWRPLGGDAWAHYYLGRASSGIPFNWQQTWLEKVLAFKTAEESGVTYSGSTTQISSASATLYYNGRARRLNAIGAYVEVVIQGGGDLFVVFYGRTDGNHVGVTLNGGSDYLLLPDDGSGNFWFDSYSDPIQGKKTVQIASGVPNGTHTLRFTVLTAKNPSSTGDRFWFNAVGWNDDTIGPWTPATDALLWATGVAVLQDETRQNGGVYYRAEASGTTGATAPTHTSGSVSDGGVTWAYVTVDKATSSYGGPRQRLQGAGSQLEYAYQIKPNGAVNKEDVGGAAHGNETQVSFDWYAGNNIVTPLGGKWIVADVFTIKEVIEATHSEIGGGSTVVVDTNLYRKFAKEFVTISHDHTINVDCEIGWFYSHMWPLLHYNAGSAGYTIAAKNFWSPSDGDRFAVDYYYDPVSPPYEDDSMGFTKDFVQIAYGPAYTPAGTLGTPGDGPTGLEFAAWLQVDGTGVDYWDDGSRTFCSKSMNPSNKNPTTIPADSMICKMYFMRNDGTVPSAYTAGDTINCKANYGLVVTAS